jgi:hypothetical protein
MRFYRAHRDIAWLGAGCFVAVAILLVIVGGITGSSLWRLLTSPFPETVVENQSNVAYVAEIDDGNLSVAHTFVFVQANARTAIDSVGEVNPPTEHVWLWDAGCANRDQVAGNYSQGGTITIAADGTTSFIEKRSDRISPTELDSGRPSCKEAAGALATRR